jgi:hypothetical protein
MGIKQPGREADHSPLPFSAEVKNGGAIFPLPHTPLCHGAYLIKERATLHVSHLERNTPIFYL